MSPALRGLHHVSAVTAHARENLDFYTHILGMRLVKKTVNQDDVSAYHLFYADALGSPGTELTFFDFGGITRARKGAGLVTETALRVGGGEQALAAWIRWFEKNHVAHEEMEESPLPSVAFEDEEGQALRLVAEPGAATGARPWRESPVPLDAAIFGLSGVTLTVRDFAGTARALTEVLGFRQNEKDAGWFDVAGGGPGAHLRLVESAERGSPGAGIVHHVAWAVEDVSEIATWQAHLEKHGFGTSGLVDRFYFQSLYFRIPGGILFEIATEKPGFTADGEDVEHLGERLSLPPFLEGRREEIEAGLRPLD